MFDGIKILEAFNYRPPMNAADSSALQTVLDTEVRGCQRDLF